MHTHTTSPQALDLLKAISTDQVFDSFYLVGGTALALQIGHRESDDLDLFTQSDFDTTLLKPLFKLGEHQVIAAHPNSIELTINKVKVHLRYFGYPLYKNLVQLHHIRLADPVDIGLMKLLSLTGRDARKDIVDLYFIDREVIALEELLTICDAFYPSDTFNLYDSTKSIFDQKVIEKQPLPKMHEKLKWEKAYQRVSQTVTAFIRQKTT